MKMLVDITITEAFSPGIAPTPTHFSKQQGDNSEGFSLDDGNKKLGQLLNARPLGESIAGQARRLCHEVIPFRNARGPRSRNSVMFDCGFVIADLLK